MKIFALIYFTSMGVVSNPYHIQAPPYVRSGADCYAFAAKAVEDFQRTQPGWKHLGTKCVVKYDGRPFSLDLTHSVRDER